MTLYAQQQQADARASDILKARFDFSRVTCERLARLAQYFETEPQEVVAKLIDNAYQRVLTD